MTQGERAAIREARAIQHQFVIEHPDEICIRKIAQICGLYIQEKIISGSQGRLVKTKDNLVATVNASIKYEEKKRFVGAHEFGHYRLHDDTEIYICTDEDFFDWHRQRPEETEANVFAAELLMPHDLFLAEARRYPPSIETIRTLADQFRVTRSAAAIRYVTLDVEPSAIVFCRDGEIKWYRCSDSMPYRYMAANEPVDGRSGAAEYFSDARAEPEAVETPVSAWFTDYGQEPGATCIEDYMVIPSLHATLSLIWLE